MLTAYEFRCLAVASHRDPRTVKAAYLGRSIRSASLAAVVDAARRLGLPLPPSPIAADEAAA